MATDDAAAGGRAGERATATGGAARGLPWRLLRGGVAAILVVKLVGVAWWYAGDIPVLLGPAPAEATAGDGKTATGAPTRVQAGDTPAHGAAPTAGAPAEHAAEDKTGKPPEVRSLVETIARRQGELDARERELAAREEHLRVFEQDVTAKVASLEEIEKRLQARAKAASTAIDAAAESLAKVYGAMKPTDAAPILERLDEPTVLTIFARMKEKQIGEILPLMSKEKAISLTQALAASAGR